MSVRAVRRIAACAIVVACAVASLAAARAQPAPSAAALSPEEERTIAYGREIFKTKATCQFCHKWDGAGDQGYGGNALSLRKTQLTPPQISSPVRSSRNVFPKPRRTPDQNLASHGSDLRTFSAGIGKPQHDELLDHGSAGCAA